MKNTNYMSDLFKNLHGLFQKKIFLRNIKGIFYYIDAFLLLFCKKAKYKKEKKKKVLLIYNLAFGDGVIWRCSAIKLRKIYPKDKYEITLICQKGIDKLYGKDDFYDEIIPLDFNKSTINLKERIKNFKILRKKYYDIIVDSVGISEWTTNIFYTRAALGKEKIGYIDNTIDFFCSRKKIERIYDKLIELNKPNVSLIEYYSYFFENMSGKKISLDVKFEKLRTNPLKIELPKKYFVIFPSASMKLKRWHLDRYAELAKKIYQKTKLELILVGTKADQEVLDEFKEILDIPYKDLVCKTSLNDYIEILKNASFIVTNDTSAYHIAVIEETPVAIITGGYTYHRYVEYNFKNSDKFKKPCIIVHKMKCFNCGNRCQYLQSNDTNWPCLEKISVSYAWKKIEKFIDDNHIGL